jgi:hypothetical protein
MLVNKQIVLVGLIVGLLSQPAALAFDWFDRYDHDHDHYWSYHEYYRARRAWEREHHEKLMSEAELRAEYDRYDADHDHKWAREEAKASGHW